VPREFWEEAVALNEEKWGKVETIEDPFTRPLRIGEDYARRMNAAKVKAAAKTDSSTSTQSAPTTKVPNKLFGGR
jgi:hypothetical protein